MCKKVPGYFVDFSRKVPYSVILLHLFGYIYRILECTVKRRTYLKSILGLGLLGISSSSLFKWFELHKAVNPKELWNKSELIAELVDLIIPATDTPGAKQAMVHEYIIRVLTNCNSILVQNKFLLGLEDVEDRAMRTYGRKFMHCTIAEKGEIYESLISHVGYSISILNKISNKVLKEPFIVKLRDLTVEGYCLSKLGATEGLAYDYIPGTYQSCIPLKLHQKSWATK